MKFPLCIYNIIVDNCTLRAREAMTAFGDQCPDYELVRIAHLGNIEYAQDCVEQLYAGELADFAQYTTLETTEVPENLQF